MGPLATVFTNLHVKCPILSAKDDEDAESHLLHSNDRMNKQGIREHVKWYMFCLTLDGDLCYKSMTPMSNNWNHLQGPFLRKILKLGKLTRRTILKMKIFLV